MAFMVSVFSIGMVESQVYDVVVADSVTHVPLPNASIYDSRGAAIGMSDNKGILPMVSQNSYPITVSYLGFNDKIVATESPDTIFLSENVSELSEVVVESRRHRVLHILAYVREYSTLTTYTDTVFLFREKMVDYMLPSDAKVKFKGWSTPRILACKSYYRFTDCYGLDSVSDVSHHHFSWADWVGLVPDVSLLPALRNAGIATDTLRGKYSAAEIWSRDNDRVTIDIDVLSDTTSRKWVPNLAGFFRKKLDFEKFKVRYNYNIAGDTISAVELTGYSFIIESNGRGHEMFRFNRVNEPYFVSTQADIYVLDKEYITVKEAKKWDKRDYDREGIDIYEPLEAPGLSSSILTLIDRVNSLDKDSIRLDIRPDRRMQSGNSGHRNFKIGRRALSLLKQVAGIAQYKFHKNINDKWSKFRKEQIQRNNQPENEE